MPVLRSQGLDVVTIGRGDTADVRADLGTTVPDLGGRSGWVLHAMGHAHSVPKTEAERSAFRRVNVEGTRNVVRALEQVDCPGIVHLSSVAVYGRAEGQDLTEDCALDARDPYGVSKRDAEYVLQEFAARRGCPLLILRLPLVAGSRAPGNLGAMVRAMRRGYYFRIGAGEARKSMVLAEDIASHVPRWFGRSDLVNLTDGHHPSLAELERRLCEQLGRGRPIAMPMSFARALALVGDLGGDRMPFSTARLAKLSTSLTFSDKRARARLGWAPRRVVDVIVP
ncbi:MAG: NAD-dependent epimerase/dehydratase family protein [Gemmatimonadaceae bacterium]|nr:NAD-dependent epimerase/dehydratase family protein [Gemmatimonadaceae bacterium]